MPIRFFVFKPIKTFPLFFKIFVSEKEQPRKAILAGFSFDQIQHLKF